MAAATVLLLWRWIARGLLSPALPAIGVVVLLVNLLAVGAIGFPAVACTLWLLLALGLNRADLPGRHVASRTTAWAALGVVAALAVACYASAYSPVLRCQTKVDLAQRESGRKTVSYSKAMLLLILVGLFALLALGTYYIGVSVGYLGLALLTMLVIVILVLATAHDDVQ